MRRWCTLRAEIFARFHDAAPEYLLPGAIDRDASGERIPFAR